MRHLVKRVRRRLLAGAQRARALAGDVAEDAAERAEAVPAGVEGDLDDRQVGVAEQGGGPLDPPGAFILVAGI